MSFSLPRAFLRAISNGFRLFLQGAAHARRSRLAAMSEDQLRDIGLMDGRRRRGQALRHHDASALRSLDVQRWHL